jgi:hypothetical protein
MSGHDLCNAYVMNSVGDLADVGDIDEGVVSGR